MAAAAASTTLRIIFFLLAALSLFLSKKHRRRLRKNKAIIPVLPPGSMGLPYLGETLKLYSQDPNVFFFGKQKKYGDVFKTHILGCPCIMMASPEASRFVLVSHAHLFKPTYPKSKEMMIGPWALFFHQGDYHAHLRKLVQSALSTEALRKLVPDIEAIAISCLDSWANGAVVNTFREMKKFSYEVGILAIFGQLDSRYKKAMKDNYCILDKGYNSFPTNIPGTPFHKALMARRRLNKLIMEIIGERKEKKLLNSDLLGRLLNSKDEKGQSLGDEKIADNIIGMLFAAQDTTASALTWILKYLHDHPHLLQALKEEQKAIYDENDGGKKSLTWSQTRNMQLTHKVILESLRMASIISFTFREAVVDVQYEGFLIPKGWKVMPLFRNIHHNPEYFDQPSTFDPSRFKVPPKANTFLPFGIGAHACPGNELAKLEMLTMIYLLLTKYRWQVKSSSNKVQYRPFPVPKHGLPAVFHRPPPESITDDLETPRKGDEEGLLAVFHRPPPEFITDNSETPQKGEELDDEKQHRSWR